jgi:hypothetical protein
MAEDLELRAKLRITDESGDAVRRLKGDLNETGHAADEAQQHMGVLEHTLSNFAAIEIGELVHGVRELASEFLHAADQGAAADQAVAALIATAQGRGWADAHVDAEKLGDELDEIAISAHQAGPAVAEAFQTMLEITGATEGGVERASDQVKQLSQIATMLGKNVGDISKEFSMMEEGVIRTKGQLFHVLGASGIFGDNTKKAAAGWAQLTEEERLNRLNYALEQMSSKAADATPTFAQLRTSVAGIFEVMSEKLGEPFLHALVPEMSKFSEELRAGLPAIEEFGKEMSVDVAKWVHEAAEAVQEGFDYLHTHGKEIHDTIVSAVETAKSVVEFIIAHKEAIALAFGAKAGIGIAGGLLKTGSESGIGKAAIGAGQAVFAAGAAGGGIAGAGGAVAGATALGAVGAALGAWVLAGEQLGKLFSESAADTRQTFDAVRQGMQSMASENTEWSDVEVSAFERMRANLLESAQYLGEDVGAAAQFADAMERSHKAHVANMKVAADLQSMAGSFEVLAMSAQFAIEDAKNAAEMAAAEKDQATFEGGTGQMIVDQFSSGFEALMAAHDTGAQQYVAHLLGSSKNLFASFLTSAHMSDEGFAALANALEAGGEQFADQAKAIRDLIGNKEHQKMNVHFSMPGAKIDIKQDFRDQDPDNIAIVLKRDLVNAAVNRIGSGFSMPFGA